MLTTKPTSDMIAEWKRIFESYRSSLVPNRKTGSDVDLYFREKYKHQPYNNDEFREILMLNIAENQHFRNKLPNDTVPNIQCYKTDGVIVAIDLCSGEFHIESENIEKVVSIHGDLFVYRGLDEDDLKNYFIVAEYVKLTQHLI